MTSPAPRLAPPQGAIDTHIHIVGDPAKYPLAPTAKLNPPVASVADFGKAVGDALGIRRAVVVQPSIYGFDNRCTMDAVKEFGPGKAWAVTSVPTDISDRDLQALTDQGARGLRFFMFPGGLYQWSDIEPLCAKIAAFGWFAQVQLDGTKFVEHAPMLRRLKLPVLLDHQGKFMHPVTPEHECVREMARFLGRDNAWIKICGVYEVSRAGPPYYTDILEVARALIDAAPERTIWASNWPHFGRKSEDNVVMLDLLLDWVRGDAALYNRILAENPLRLLGEK